MNEITIIADESILYAAQKMSKTDRRETATQVFFKGNIYFHYEYSLESGLASHSLKEITKDEFEKAKEFLLKKPVKLNAGWVKDIEYRHKLNHVTNREYKFILPEDCIEMKTYKLTPIPMNRVLEQQSVFIPRKKK